MRISDWSSDVCSSDLIFGAIMPAFVGFANWMIPLQIGASDMAFARMNNFSFWLLPIGAILFTVSFFVPGGANAAGWTMYAPLSLQMGRSDEHTSELQSLMRTSYAVFCLHKQTTENSQDQR